MAARLAPGDDVIGFAALTHDLGKALTPADVLPKHIGHEQAGIAPLKALCERLKVPAAHRELAVMACREHLNVHRLDELRDATVFELLARCDAFRKPERIAQLARVCERHGVPLKAAALQFPAAHPVIAAVLTGARSRGEVTENVTLFDQSIPDELWCDLKTEGLIADDAPTPDGP